MPSVDIFLEIILVLLVKKPFELTEGSYKLWAHNNPATTDRRPFRSYINTKTEVQSVRLYIGTFGKEL